MAEATGGFAGYHVQSFCFAVVSYGSVMCFERTRA